MSDLADGECDPAVVEALCRRWRNDESLRADWHAYQLIGDVMRADDMAFAPGQDAAFLNRLRQRLKDEPVPLAPSPLPRKERPAWRWMTPLAAIAGFVVVGVAVVVLRGVGFGGDGGGIADASGPGRLDAPVVTATAPLSSSTPIARPVAAVAHAASSQAMMIDSQLIRDVRLDAYFQAHRGSIGAVPSAMPGSAALLGIEMRVPQQ